MTIPTLNLNLGTKEFVLVPVFAKVDGAVFDPTGDVVEVAVIAGNDPPLVAATDWKVAAWETAVEGNQTTYLARLLVGTTGTTGGSVTLTLGSYRIWVRVTDNPEKPVKSGGVLTVA